jgi:hypothetical protein
MSPVSKTARHECSRCHGPPFGLLWSPGYERTTSKTRPRRHAAANSRSRHRAVHKAGRHGLLRRVQPLYSGSVHGPGLRGATPPGVDFRHACRHVASVSAPSLSRSGITAWTVPSETMRRFVDKAVCLTAKRRYPVRKSCEGPPATISAISQGGHKIGSRSFSSTGNVLTHRGGGSTVTLMNSLKDA